MLAGAKEATPQLPGFEKYEPDWDSYINFTLENGPGVRAKLLAHPDWWPELDSFVKKISDGQQSKVHTNGRLADNTSGRDGQIAGEPRSVKQSKRLLANLQGTLLIISQIPRNIGGFPRRPRPPRKPAP